MRSLAAAFIVAALPAGAAEVADCAGFTASAVNIAEPWEANTRTFANGAVRLAVLDTIEPAAAAFHLLVLSPPYHEVGGRQCRIISFFEGSGYGGMTLDGMSADYDPARGLIFGISVSVYNPDTARFDPGELQMTLNQSTGEIIAEDIGS